MITRSLVALGLAAQLGACAGGTPRSHGPASLELAVRPLAPEELIVADTPAGPSLADPHREVAARVLEAALTSDRAWPRLAHLTDRIGHRLSGSAALEQAVTYTLDLLRTDGQENVRGEKVMVPRWVRGDEALRVVAPVDRPLVLLALGDSAGTPRGGVTADVVAVHSFEELDRLGEAGVRGKVVLFNKVMPPHGPDGPRYGETVGFRTQGPARASKLGAAAALVRSVTATSLRTPHTGATDFPEGTNPIPAAAITVEDTELLLRLLAAGPVRVKLELGAKTLPDAESANVVAEIVGREKPDEIVLVGGHLDSWDVGQGAHDDGGPCIAVIEALWTIRSLGLRPRRTIRAVLFTNEENGLRGAKEYAAAHAAEKHVAAIETDTGVFAPRGFRVQANDVALRQVKELARLLEPLGATEAFSSFAGADLMPLAKSGVPALGLHSDTSRYFDYHHSPADTLDKVSPDDLRKHVAALAVMTWALAETSIELGKE